MTRTTLLAVGASVLASACVINGDKWQRPRDLEQSWLVSRTRILGIRAEPPEIAPGQRAELQSLIGFGPEPEDLVRIWVGCEQEDGPCLTGGLDQIDLKNPDPKTLAELGFLGIEPGPFPPTYTAPADLLDELPEEDRLEGRNVTVQLTAFPAEQLDAETPPEKIDFNQVEAGYKRLPVSLATTPNNNPVLDGIAVDDEAEPGEDLFEVRAGSEVTLTLRAEEARLIEEYEFVTSNGQVEDRVEDPYVTWYVTDGDMLDPLNLWPHFSADWVAPEDAGVRGTWFAVVRDRRGGMAWSTREWATVDP